MKIRGAKDTTSPKGLEKVPTGIAGLDEITGGGLPKGRPTLVRGAAIHDLVARFQPAAVVIDPVTNLTTVGSVQDVRATLSILIDPLKERQITVLATSLTSGGSSEAQSEVGISSLMDTWLLLRNLESNGERNRILYILKSRGMAHSNQVREFVLSDKGIQLIDVAEAKRAEIRHRRATVNAQIESLKADLAADQELKQIELASLLRRQEATKALAEMAQSRIADSGRAERRK